jgi:hypothetical protein
MALDHPVIVEVVERTAQGMTRPYRCRADDGQGYFVKSAGAGWRSVVCEWVAGRLALAFGLPLPPIAQVLVEDGLAQVMRGQGDRDLAAGLAFGSRRVEHVRDFEPALLPHCQPEFRRDLVAFDWWVRNADRTLGDLAGNPNLLWATARGEPVVIDHNLAFDTGFDDALFVQTHVFGADWRAIEGDWVARAHYEQRFGALIPLLDAIWPELPHNWLHNESGQARITRQEIEQVLERVHREDFWQRRP